MKGKKNNTKINGAVVVRVFLAVLMKNRIKLSMGNGLFI